MKVFIMFIFILIFAVSVISTVCLFIDSQLKEIKSNDQNKNLTHQIDSLKLQLQACEYGIEERDTVISYQTDHAYRMLIIFDLWMQKYNYKTNLPYSIKYIKSIEDSILNKL